ncbi:MAG: UpxY family transcription antiterminator [Acidobacteriota bacterium]
MNEARESAPAAEPKSDWYAVTTRSRHEKVVAEQLWQKEIECFLPLRDVLSQWKDRRKKVQFPLFPGYLFVKVHMKDRRVDILKVPSVASIVGLNGHPLPIPAEQLDSVKRLVFSTLPYDPYPYIVEGDRVEIIRGALQGLQGILLEKKGRYRFILSVDLIQQAIACEVDSCDVEKIR